MSHRPLPGPGPAKGNRREIRASGWLPFPPLGPRSIILTTSSISLAAVPASSRKSKGRCCVKSGKPGASRSALTEGFAEDCRPREQLSVAEVE